MSKVNTNLISWTPHPLPHSSPHPSLPTNKKRKKKAEHKAQQSELTFPDFPLSYCRWLLVADKSIKKPKQVAVWATASTRSGGPPGHPQAYVSAFKFFSNKLWFSRSKISTTLSLTFVDSSPACRPDPPHGKSFGSEMMTIFKLQHRPQKEHRIGPSTNQAASTLCRFI